MPSLRTESMRRRFGLYAAFSLCVFGIPATAASERFERWSLEQPGDFILALSFKRSISFDDRTATSELAFLCNQEEKYVAVLLIPLDGTFTSRHKATPVSIQKIEDQSGPTDLMQRWEDGPGYIFLGIARHAGGTCLVPRTEKPRARNRFIFISPTIWMRVRKLPITLSLTLRDFRAEWQHLQAAANRRGSRSCSYA